MREVIEGQEAGGSLVRELLTSHRLESRITWKLGRTVRRGAVGKVLLDSNSLAAYPTTSAR